MRQIVLLVNPSAGGVDDDGAISGSVPEGPIAEALEALRAVGSVEVVVADGPDAIRAAVETLAEGGIVALAGGDGTLHRTINALSGRTHPYLVIPAGTGNDFAGGIGVPADLAAAAAVASSGRARPLDVLQIGDLVAVNAAHLGVGVQAAEAASDLKGALGKLAYPAGAVAAAARFDPTVVTVEVDGDVVVDAEPVAMVAICNGSTVGGGTALCPPADPGDGVADVVVLRAMSGPALAATAAALVRGTHLQRDDVLHRRAEVVRVLVHDVDVATWNVDGELLELAADQTCRLRPAAWRLLLP